MAINLAAIKDLLLPGLHDIFGDYNEIPAQWSQVFEKAKSDKAAERQVEIRLLGLAELRDEGAPTQYDNGMGQRYVYNYLNRGVGLGFIITRNAIKDNQYKQDFGPNTSALKRSFLQTKEIYGANILNNAATYDATIGGDGVSLVNTGHIIDGTTVANRPVIDVELNETSLQDGVIGVRRFKDAAGLRYLSKSKKLIVPVELEFTARRILKTDLRVGTTDNDISALKDMGIFGDEPVVMDFLTSPKYWFIKTDAPTGLTYMDRESFETDMLVDFDTDNLKVKGYERYAFGYGNWRTVYGSLPT